MTMPIVLLVVVAVLALAAYLKVRPRSHAAEDDRFRRARDMTLQWSNDYRAGTWSPTPARVQDDRDEHRGVTEWRQAS